MKERKFLIPYGDSHLPLVVPESSLQAVLESKVEGCQSQLSEDAIVLEALRAPLGSPRLAELAVGKSSAVIIVSDHTRPVPSQHILPWMLAELRLANPQIVITLLVATGFHRGTTAAELEAKLGPDIFRRERVVVHDCQDASSLAHLGTLPSGARLSVNRIALETDLLLAEGFIEPHLFAGFSGGRKSILPGICDRITVLGNHCGAFIADPLSRPGVLEGNPIHRDMLAAAQMAKLAFIVNVVIDTEKKVVAAFAGEPVAAHHAGCEFLSGLCRVRAKPAPIVVTSNGGAPLDQNIYQCVKGLVTAETAAADGGVIIFCGECRDGSGGEDFHRALRDCDSPQALFEKVCQVPMDATEPDQWEYQILARILAKHPVIFVTRPDLRQMVEDMKMTWAPSLEDALDLAWQVKGSEAKVTVIPNGLSVVVS